MLKIFHTADLHIGMKFNSYPTSIRDRLIEARFDVLDKMVQMANDEQCNSVCGFRDCSQYNIRKRYR